LRTISLNAPLGVMLETTYWLKKKKRRTINRIEKTHLQTNNQYFKLNTENPVREEQSNPHAKVQN
jgi:hypothetical protein